MARGAPAAQRWIEISPERIARWLESFTQRHGETAAEAGPGVVVCRAADGAVAECHVPFPPLPSAAGPRAAGPQEARSGEAGSQGAGSPPAGWYGARMAEHAAADRTVGVLLVRLGGYAAGIFTGSPPDLAASKVGSRLVHGRSAAGGWSQHRFARRREKQAAEALAAAAETALAVFGRWPGSIDAVVLGGDKRTVAALRDDPRLGGDPRLRAYLDMAVERFLTVPDPRLAVLRDAPRLFRAIRIRLAEPDAGGPGPTGQR